MGAPDGISRNVEKKNKRQCVQKSERVRQRAEEVSCRLHKGKERVSQFFIKQQ